MAYRRTENVVRRLHARHDAIVDAARAAATEGGMTAIQIAPVAARAGVAAGTVYRYFPGKIDLVSALVESESESEIKAVRRAADAAPGPLSALAAAVATFGARALRSRRLAWAVMAEPVDTDMDSVRQKYRSALAAEFEGLIRAAIAGGHLRRRRTIRARPARRLARRSYRPAGARTWRRAGALARRGADADAVRAPRARRARRPRPRPRGADGAAGPRQELSKN